METILADRRVWTRIQDCKIGPSGPCLNVIGLYLSETKLRASRVQWQCKTEQAGSWTAKAVPLSFAGRFDFPLKWQGVSGLFVPLPRMDFLCAENLTVRQAFSSCILQALQTIFRTTYNDLQRTFPTLIALHLPERSSWRKYDEDFIKLLRGILELQFPAEFERIMRESTGVESFKIGRITAAFASLSRLFSSEDGRNLTVRIDNTWTEFILRDAQHKVLQQGSAAIAIPENYELAQTPIAIRLNDFLNDSTAVWHEAHFSSWLESFDFVCREFQRIGWAKADRAAIISPWEKRPEVEAVLRRCGLLDDLSPPCAFPHPENALAVFAGREILDRLSSAAATAEKSPQNQLSATPDIPRKSDPFADIFSESATPFSEKLEPKSFNPFDF